MLKDFHVATAAERRPRLVSIICSSSSTSCRSAASEPAYSLVSPIDGRASYCRMVSLS